MTDAKRRELERNAQTIEDKVRLARAYKRAGENNKAEQVIRSLLAENPGNAELSRAYIENSHILEKDQAHLTFVADALREQRFETYLVGSSIDGRYSDIDLVVRKLTDLPVTDFSHAEYEYHARLELSNLIWAQIRKYAGETFRSSSRDQRQTTYCGSEVTERHRVQIGTTLIDISYSQDPFTQNPNTSRVRLT